MKIHLIDQFTRKDPKAEIGPDGMTDCSREMHKQWRRRDEAQAKIDAVIAERTGIDADLVPFMRYESLIIATLLGLKVAE